LIELWLTSSQSLTNITFVVTSLDYQTVFANQIIKIVSALPTSSITTLASLTIAAVNITSTLALQNWKVNRPNTYTLNVQPIAKAGYLSISLPTYMSSQLNSTNSSLTLTVNGSVSNSNLLIQNGQTFVIVPVTPSTKTVSLLLAAIVNPIDNTPYAITISQASD
jgi:hypothetical protein